MSQFIVRVELHKANQDDYETLHQAMYDEDLFRIIQDDFTKKFYVLPPAEYNYVGDITDKNEVLNKVERAAKKTNRSYSIIVTKSEGIIFTGLEELD
ncbi:hypothetical protein [Chryseobacterium viscerum]|uniref:DUF2622 domain-containing protein n=1 Tax=Chryseobacterium viscerum TaxID=1037377 RepID=A0A5N4BP47_9FLAO|nr:hypothetical protein [Chryseobacterium viscerum]KAB1230197.1 hypothetical protein F8D52_13500 [Chryseobacterium viscerum]